MYFWIRCDTADNAKALLAMVVCGTFNSGSHPRCRLSEKYPDSIHVQFEDHEESIIGIGQLKQVEEIGVIHDDEVLPDLWVNRAEMLRVFLT